MSAHAVVMTSPTATSGSFVGFDPHNMAEKFGPIRTVKPALVFEQAFEGLNRLRRHKSGIGVRFPRIIRWRTDKTAAAPDTLETIRALLPPEEIG